MSIEKLEEFAKSGEKHLNGISTELGFSSSEKPERQWFNYLFNDISRKTNQVIDSLSDVVFNFAGYEAKVLALEENYEGISSEISAVSSNFQDADSVLQSQINSIGGGKFAYTTYTKMVDAAALPAGDPLKLPANSSIDVTNDTDTTKNGMYAYNGTVFTKSTYDPLTQGKAYTDTAKADTLLKVQNVFTTKALMTASTLPDGSNAQVNSDTTADNNGFYKKTAGVWAFASYSPLTQAKSYTDERAVFTDDSSIFNIKDLNSNVTLQQKRNGDIDAPSLGNLTQRFENLVNNTFSITDKSTEHVYQAAKYADYILADKAPKFLAVGDLINAETVNALGLLTHNVTDVRIPALTRIAKNKYLVTFEARGGGGDFGEASVMSATITIDVQTKAFTVADYRVIHNSFLDGDGKKRTFMQAVSVRLNSGRIICIYIRRYLDTEHQIYKRHSDDDGKTWSDFTDISAMKDALGWNLLTPNSQGLVHRHGRYKGRVVFPVWTTQQGYTGINYRSGFIYSDDDGLTWQLGDFIDLFYTNECQCVEDFNGDLIFAIRVERIVTSGLIPKIFARWSARTGKYKIINTGKDLSEERIMSGLIQGDNKFDHTPAKLLFSTCLYGTGGRKGLGIYTSYDAANTWNKYSVAQLETVNVSYTCIESVTPDLVFVLYESVNAFKYVLVSTNNLVNGDA